MHFFRQAVILFSMITSEQIRAAMGVLRWSRRELSEITGVHEGTIKRIAENTGVPNTNAQFLVAIQKACEKGNGQLCVRFTDNGIHIVYILG